MRTKIGNMTAGFGSLCIVPQLLFSFLLSEAIMGMAFPLFVLMACESDPQAQFNKGEHMIVSATDGPLVHADNSWRHNPARSGKAASVCCADGCIGMPYMCLPSGCKNHATAAFWKILLCEGAWDHLSRACMAGCHFAAKNC